MTSSPSFLLNGLDLRVVIQTPIRQFIPWLVLVLLVAFVGYPGVICVTPMAWLIALRVGNACVSRSKSGKRSYRIIEATIAGGLLGLLQGILFAGISPLMGSSTQTSEQMKMNSIMFMIFLLGIFVGAGLAFSTAYLSENRRETRQRDLA